MKEKGIGEIPLRFTTNGTFGDKGSLDVDEEDDEDCAFLASLQKTYGRNQDSSFSSPLKSKTIEILKWK